MQDPDAPSWKVSEPAPGLVPDDAIIARIRAGDTGAYGVVMRRYNQRLFRVARGILRDGEAAKDAVQDAYVQAYVKLDTFAPTGNFGAWLTRITINEALMSKRKRDSLRLGSEAANSEDGGVAPRADPADVVANRELTGLIEDAVDGLPLEFRTVFVLRAIQQLSVDETAESIGIPQATVKTRFHRARKLLQKQLQRHLDAAGLTVFEFAGKRCDDVVKTVLARLGAGPAFENRPRSFH